MSFLDLIKIKGIGKVKALEVMAICEISKRFNNSIKTTFVKIWNYEEIFKFIINNNYNLEKENFWILIFDHKNKLIKEIHFEGKRDPISFSETEILKLIIEFENSKVVIVHNHPSNVLKFSSDDIKSTIVMKKQLVIFNIKLIEHVLISKDDYILLWNKNKRYF